RPQRPTGHRPSLIRPASRAQPHGNPVVPFALHQETHMSRNDVLVDADWVEAHLDDPKVAVVEVDEDTSAYEKNHIRNAIRIDWRRDLQDPVRRDFVNKEQFETLLSERGIA